MKIPNNCITTTTNFNITLKDKGNPQKIIIKNPHSFTIEIIKVDGCAVTGNIQRCDYMLKITDHPNIQEYFIEFKGSNLSKALEQIINTCVILSNNKGIKKGFIICNRSPENSTENQILKRKARKQNIILIIKSRILEYVVKDK